MTQNVLYICQVSLARDIPIIKENYNNRSLSKISNEEQLLLQYLLNTKDKDLRYYLATYINLSEDDLSNPFKVTQHIFQFLNGFYDGEFIKNLNPEKLSKHSLYLLNSIKSMRGQCRHQAVIADLFIRVLIGLDCRVVHNHQHSFLYISGGPILDVRYFLNKQQHKAKIFKGILRKETLLNAILSDNLKLKFNEFIMNPHKYLKDDFNLFASHYHTVKDKNNFDLLKIDTCKKPLSVSDENNRSFAEIALIAVSAMDLRSLFNSKKDVSDINQKTLHYIDQKKLSILAELKKDKPNFNRLFLECKHNDKTTREILTTFIIKTYLTKLPKKTQTIYQRIPKQVFKSTPDIPIYGRVIELGNEMVVRTQKPVNLPVKSVGIHNDSSSNLSVFVCCKYSLDSFIARACLLCNFLEGVLKPTSKIGGLEF